MGDMVKLYRVWFSYRTDPTKEKYYTRYLYTKAQAKELAELYQNTDRFDSGIEYEQSVCINRYEEVTA